MKLRSLPDPIVIDDGQDDEDISGAGMAGAGQIARLVVNVHAVNQDGSRKREIEELADSIRLEREEMTKLKPNDPRWTSCFARLNALLSQRDRLKDS